MKTRIQILIALGVICCVTFIPYQFDKLLYFTSGIEDRDIRSPIDAFMIDIIYNGLFNLSTQIKIPDPLPEYQNPCWYFRLYRNVTTMFEGAEFSRNVHFRLNDLFRFRNDELISLYKSNKPQLRCLPHVFAIGFPKCASTDFYFRLTQHQQIFRPTDKEFHWWTKKRRKNIHLDVYMHQFDIAANKIHKSCPVTSNQTNVIPCLTVDGSPSTVFWPTKLNEGQLLTPEAESLTPAFLKKLLPDIKILVIMKNPTLRLHSEYFCFRKTEVRKPENFHRAAMQSLRLMKDCISSNGPRQCAYNSTLHRSFQARIHVGMYSIFLKDWLKIFQRNQIFTLTTEEYSSHTNQVLNDVARFLHLDPYATDVVDGFQLERRRNEHSNGQPSSNMTMWADTKQMLVDFYQPYNEELAVLLGDDKFKWGKES